MLSKVSFLTNVDSLFTATSQKYERRDGIFAYQFLVNSAPHGGRRVRKDGGGEKLQMRLIPYLIKTHSHQVN